MRRVCPACGAIISAEAWENDANQRQFDAIISRMPTSVSRSITAYFSLFRPLVPADLRGYRGLSWSRALRLAGEVNQIIKETHISWKHKPARPIDAAQWGMAIEKIVANPPRDLPLTNHNYLRSVAYGIADDSDRAAEVRRNKMERDGTLRAKVASHRKDSEVPSGPLSPEVLRSIREKNMGKKRSVET